VISDSTYLNLVKKHVNKNRRVNFLQKKVNYNQNCDKHAFSPVILVFYVENIAKDFFLVYNVEFDKPINLVKLKKLKDMGKLEKRLSEFVFSSILFPTITYFHHVCLRRHFQ